MLPPGIAAAHRTTHIETNLATVPLTRAGALHATFARQQLQTFRLEPAAGPNVRR
jgi:hypothetical protein